MADEEIKALERRVSVLETRDAVRQERDNHIDRRFDTLERMVGETQGTLKKASWIIISTVIILSTTAAFGLVTGVITVGQ